MPNQLPSLEVKVANLERRVSELEETLLVITSNMNKPPSVARPVHKCNPNYTLSKEEWQKIAKQSRESLDKEYLEHFSKPFCTILTKEQLDSLTEEDLKGPFPFDFNKNINLTK